MLNAHNPMSPNKIVKSSFIFMDFVWQLCPIFWMHEKEGGIFLSFFYAIEVIGS